jgi:hypothetical protein
LNTGSALIIRVIGSIAYAGDEMDDLRCDSLLVLLAMVLVGVTLYDLL